mmetsp:Transcript_37701/g.82817  ORF Transcript_37701/g.82817 Transcript_37701/m.82817 type:complete len:247 (+) Transcript_37701:1554-2294(+)
MHDVPVLEKLSEPCLRDALRQCPLTALRLRTQDLHIVLREKGRIPWLGSKPGLPVNQLVCDDVHLVVVVLVRPVQVQILQLPASEWCRALQQVVLALPSLKAAGSRRTIRVGKVRQLAHEGPPVDAPPLDVLGLMPRELRGPEELNSLARDVIARCAQSIGELRLADLIVTLRVDFTECLPQPWTSDYEAVHQSLGDVMHRSLLGLMRRSTNFDRLSVDEVRELLEGHSALAVLVDCLDEHVALLH